MREKVKRILDLVRAGKLTLDDAAPLMAALSPKLALTDSDRELVASLLARDELDTAQVAEHLLLLRGIRDSVPPPPPPPGAPRFGEGFTWDGRRGRRGPVDGLVDRLTGGIETMVDSITEQVERAAQGSAPRYSGGRPTSSRVLRIQVESQHGDEYTANIPVSLAPHLHRLIPPHGLAALEEAGFSVETLQLLIEADPPPGPLIDAEDQHGNEVHISLK
ncbi:SHOCT-like domain-containing protein [Deinococcus koreensis]|uniref:DUF2089 domain-containing protein n=1 Tax=Deinococcus koreensis TaxID=2054903 RepID=A0A2K3UX58_9DEIO|nr:hypothetical protein [Deinococcus koreensis]PNY81111.1 hypothetical protein CVO96_06725 [Deinococcus koreensis]